MKIWKEIALALVLIIVTAYIRNQEPQRDVRPTQMSDEDTARHQERMFHRKLIDDQLDERRGR